MNKGRWTGIMDLNGSGRFMKAHWSVTGSQTQGFSGGGRGKWKKKKKKEGIKLGNWDNAKAKRIMTEWEAENEWK
jgi:hypothetical protein